MKRSACVLLLSLSLLLLAIIVLPQTEGFGATSPGTLVQLASSHVPTEEDEEYLRTVYPRLVDRDLRNMTGGGL